VLAGFSERYHAQLTGTVPVPTVIHWHAAVFGAWFVLVLAQTTLVAAGHSAVHRRLGVAAVVLAPAAIAIAALTTVEAARHGANPGNIFANPRAFMALGFVDLVLFTGFVTAALVSRRRPELHKRLMILACVILLWPAITRLPSFAGTRPLEPLEFAALLSLLALFALSGPLYDLLSRRRVHAIEIVGGCLIVAGRPIARFIGTTSAWQSFAGWLIG
jgi:hypothetical protein